MRTKLFLLLILSSLASLSYSQKLNQKDFQGLWYRIYSFEKNYDSLYNLNFEKFQFQEPVYLDSFYTLAFDSTETDTPKFSNFRTEFYFSNNPDERSMEYKFGNYEPLELFEVCNNQLTFYEDIYKSNLVYTNQERKGNKENFEHEKEKYKYQYLFKTDYNLESNKLLIRKFNSDLWSDNRILYFKNDTIIIRNSKQNFYNVYVHKTIDKEIDYKPSNLFLSHSYCFGSCPKFTISMINSGKIFFEFEDGSYGFKQKDKDGVYTLKVTPEQFSELFDVLKYLNFNKVKKFEYSLHPHDSNKKMKITLSNKKQIVFKNYSDDGPVEIRILDHMLQKLVFRLANIER